MLFKIPMLPFITVMSHLSPCGREYRWGGCAPWRAVNNLRFCFIGNRDVVVVLCYRTPLGQGLQTHLSRLHHAKEVKSQFLSYFYSFHIFLIALSAYPYRRVFLLFREVTCCSSAEPYGESFRVSGCISVFSQVACPVLSLLMRWRLLQAVSTCSSRRNRKLLLSLQRWAISCIILLRRESQNAGVLHAGEPLIIGPA